MTDWEVNGGEHQHPAAHDTSATGIAMMPAYPHVVEGGMVQPQSQQQAASSLNLALQSHAGPVYQPREGVMCTQSTFFVETNPSRQLLGHMYVECLKPLLNNQLPIILIHGDFHTGQIWSTKPDGNPGWASYFCYNGRCVYVVDLPPFGRSNIDCRPLDPARMSNETFRMDESTVERALTAPGKQESERWAGARNHSQWPGTGQRGDPIFQGYYASLVPLQSKKVDRQALAQDALARLLERTGRAVLVGEGAGATMAWLAADLKPDLVAAVVAVEPAGPPAGSATHMGEDGLLRYSRHIKYAPGVRPYGLADIPLTYDPPLGMPSIGAAHYGPALDLATAFSQSGDISCVLQPGGIARAGYGPVPEPRKLVNLRQIPHAIVTAQASSHSTYDWAAIQFMRQAGVGVFHIRLEEYYLFGNGHLMFLESNSDEIASLIDLWIGMKT
ncbi:hypothetical protein TOPH_04330 [Tolypocladium ophioglossoides CBS 100239]|uniref:Uncharacterized protein n=1 Tax=Tolypocladium ophioglossoides (strain CBS 100239) TaxID=1163406 RepID=A0A0L0NAC6_TOLOC|nr:hypothetical protein TOPH_04330 [Tolypocladium ophioglossoides CBS 100239]